VKTILKDYNLFYDGSIEVDPSFVASMILKNVPLNKIFVTQMSDDIDKFNINSSIKMGVKDDLEDIYLSWSLPGPYKYMDIDEYLLNLTDNIEKDHLYEQRLKRLADEIVLFKQYNLDDVLKVIVFIVDEMKKKNAVWGVGRGSSCSSYILYLIGLHDVDPVLYEIDIQDFLK
jgi:DNA polymerase III alpha subunit